MIKLQLEYTDADLVEIARSNGKKNAAAISDASRLASGHASFILLFSN